ncbi:PAS domain S-box protein, partial [Bacillaceae bacterium Marseille-Q3522]|nr:PAS domain S-box protein [Bacillaceae bacterium Marseille-Q3522]
EQMKNNNNNWTLRISEESFYSFFEKSLIGAAFVDLTGNLVKVNDAFCDILGVAISDFTTLNKAYRKLFNTYNWNDGFPIKKVFQNNDDKIHHYKTNFINGYGEELEVLITISIVENHPAYEDMFLLQIQNITDYHLIEERLSVTEDKLNSVLESIPDGIFVLNVNGEVQKINKGFEQIFGWKENELKGSRLPLTPPELLKETDLLLSTVISGKTVKNYETVKAHKNGKRINVSMSLSPIKGKNGDRVAIVGISRDITEKKKMQEVVHRAEKINLIGQMTASLTHEIRNPMSVIRGFIQLIKEQNLDPDTERQYFELIIAELDRANEMINDFLSLSKSRIVDKRPTDLNEVIRSLYPMISSEGNMAAVTVSFYLQTPLPLILIDSREIKQLILNLVRNSCEAMKSGDKLEIITEHLSMEKVVQLHIRDTGSGIPKEYLEKIFDPYFTSKEGGTGLGLAVCKSICEGHNASLQIESEEGKGTSVIIHFAVS